MVDLFTILLYWLQVNTLSQPVFIEFKDALSKAQSDPAISSIVLISGKPECFIAGADIAYVLRILLWTQKRFRIVSDRKKIHKIDCLTLRTCISMNQTKKSSFHIMQLVCQRLI